MLCSAIKLWGKIKRRREWSEWWCLTSHVIMTNSAFLEVAEHLPADVKKPWSDFALFVWMALLYLLSCLYLNSQVFSFLPFLFFPASHRGGHCEWLCGAELPAQINPQVCFLAPSVGPEGLKIMTDLIGVCSTGFTAVTAVWAINWQAAALTGGPACFALY